MVALGPLAPFLNIQYFSCRLSSLEYDVCLETLVWTLIVSHGKKSEKSLLFFTQGPGMRNSMSGWAAELSIAGITRTLPIFLVVI